MGETYTPHLSPADEALVQAEVSKLLTPSRTSSWRSFR